MARTAAKTKLFYSVAKRSPVYQALRDAANRLLDTEGKFTKKELIVRVKRMAGLSADVQVMEIRWDYVVRMLNENRGWEVAGVAEQYFKPDLDNARYAAEIARNPTKYADHGDNANDREYRLQHMPERYRANGGVGETYGYVRLDHPKFGGFMGKKLARDKQVAEGAGQRHNTTMKKGQVAGVHEAVGRSRLRISGGEQRRRELEAERLLAAPDGDGDDD